MHCAHNLQYVKLTIIASKSCDSCLAVWNTAQNSFRKMLKMMYKLWNPLCSSAVSGKFSPFSTLYCLCSNKNPCHTLKCVKWGGDIHKSGRDNLRSQFRVQVYLESGVFMSNVGDSKCSCRWQVRWLLWGREQHDSSVGKAFQLKAVVLSDGIWCQPNQTCWVMLKLITVRFTVY